MRPQSIVNFERVVLASILLGIVNTGLIWDDLQAAVATTGMGTGLVLGIQAVTIGLYLLLIWFISRKGSPVAKWIYVVLCVIGLVFGLLGLGEAARLYGTVPLVITVVQYVLSLVSLWLLFRPDSKTWFSDGRGPADPNVFS